MGILDGKIAIVTGASSGIGRGIAQRLARDGAHVLVNYHGDREGAEEVVRLITSEGGMAQSAEADISESAGAMALFATASALGQPHILVNNAGVGAMQPLAEFDTETYDKVFGLNVRGTLFALRAASLHLADEGRIVNIASSSAVYPWPNTAVYAASKASVMNLTEVAAVELGARRINVNCVVPGIIDTPMSARIPQAAKQPVIDASPWKRLGRPEDIAAVVAFLTGPDSLWVTGQCILANGGAGH